MTCSRPHMQLYDSKRCGLSMLPLLIMFKKSLQSFTPSLPLVTGCGWKIKDGILIPISILTEMLPAAEVAID